MTTFRICLIGQHQPLVVDLPFADVFELGEASSRAKFLAGALTEPDENGVCRRVMIATNRIQCAFDAD